MPRSKISPAELASIVDHLDDMIEHAISGLKLQRSVPKKERTLMVVNSIKYWQNIISGYKWAKRLAYQRAGHIHGEHRGITKLSQDAPVSGSGDIRGLLAKTKDFGIRHAESIGQEIRPSGARNVGRNTVNEYGGVNGGKHDGS